MGIVVDFRIRVVCRGVALALLAGTGVIAAAAQAQSNGASQTIPGLDSYSLPSSRPTPRPIPTPAPTTRPRDVPSPEPSRPLPAASPAVPSEGATPVPRATAPAADDRPPPVPPTGADGSSPTAPGPSPVALPDAAPAPGESPPSAVPTTAAGPAPFPDPEAPRPLIEPGRWGWAGVAVVAMLFALLGIWLWWRDRTPVERAEQRRDSRHQIFELGAAPDAPAVTSAPEAPPPIAAASAPVAQPARAMLDIALTPKRAGTNLLSASVEYRLDVHNGGDLPATDVRLDIRLFGAGREQDAILAALYASPIAQPITAPFEIEPGAALHLDGVAMHPRDTLEPLAPGAAGGPALFVPVVSVNLRYGWACGGAGQSAGAFVIGIVRGEGGKLQPFRRDGTARMHDMVAALPYAAGMIG